MSVRCKVCNTSKNVNDQTDSDETWECKTCGNTLNAQGHVVAS
ncbi:MAG: hypothetical protein ACW9XH_04275 [Candidatus Nitrosopumilus sp. bin_32a]